MTAETVRLLLVGCLLGLYVLAMFNLRRRSLTLAQIAAWGLLALLIPALGPFLVIVSRPSRRVYRPGQSAFRR
jgi:hypothetical protein